VKDCFLCDVNPATHDLKIPCAPGGKLSICEKCKKAPDMINAVWRKYQASHKREIDLFKTPGNPRN